MDEDFFFFYNSTTPCKLKEEVCGKINNLAVMVENSEVGLGDTD